MSSKALAWIAAIVVVIAMAAGTGVYFMSDVEYKTADRISPVQQGLSEGVGSESAATPSSSAPPPPVRQHVAQAMPTRLTVWKEGDAPILSPGGGEAQNITSVPAVANEAGVVNPSSMDLLSVQNDPRLDWAVLPGTGVGTTVLLCHTLAGGDLPCNALGVLPVGDATGSGYRAKLELPTGELTFGLDHVYDPDKTSTKNWSVLFTKESDRMLVGMCRLEVNPGTGQIKNTYQFTFLEFRLIESISY